jgi:hypothetical protein
MRKAMLLAGPDDPREPLHILDHQCEIFGGGEGLTFNATRSQAE